MRICAGARISAARTSALSVLTAGGITGSFSNGVANSFNNCIGYHSGQTTAKSVAGYGRIQAHTGNNPVYFSGDPGNSYDQKHPWQHGHSAGHITQGGYEQLQEDDVHHHHHAHGAKHPAPALKDVFRVFASAHAESQGGQQNQNGCDDIPLRNLEAQLYKLPHDDKSNNDDQQPGSAKIKIVFVRNGDRDTGRDLQQGNHLCRDPEANITDLLTGQKQKAKHKRSGKQKFGIFPFKAKP
ncbi:hypothetical protein [Flavonifractor sp. An306]|uniref:hypothetical protein n=1 Tax=Flavonifractor sp. An306 TaxID=1965629 RepID=UPI00174BBB3C|nr:hypothetical protein [Flavonifractor sp. An306]